MVRFQHYGEFLPAGRCLGVDVAQDRHPFQHGDHVLGDLHEARRGVADEAHAHAAVAVAVLAVAAFGTEVEAHVRHFRHHFEQPFLHDSGGVLAVFAHGHEDVAAIGIEVGGDVADAEFVALSHDAGFHVVHQRFHAFQGDGAAHPEAEFQRAPILGRAHVHLQRLVGEPAARCEQRRYQQRPVAVAQGEQDQPFVAIRQPLEDPVARLRPAGPHAGQHGRREGGGDQ